MKRRPQRRRLSGLLATLRHVFDEYEHLESRRQSRHDLSGWETLQAFESSQAARATRRNKATGHLGPWEDGF